jgi:hypothetical protein
MRGGIRRYGGRTNRHVAASSQGGASSGWTHYVSDRIICLRAVVIGRETFQKKHRTDLDSTPGLQGCPKRNKLFLSAYCFHITDGSDRKKRNAVGVHLTYTLDGGYVLPSFTRYLEKWIGCSLTLPINNLSTSFIFSCFPEFLWFLPAKRKLDWAKKGRQGNSFRWQRKKPHTHSEQIRTCFWALYYVHSTEIITSKAAANFSSAIPQLNVTIIPNLFTSRVDTVSLNNTIGLVLQTLYQLQIL